jgi:hypothetical protein
VRRGWVQRRTLEFTPESKDGKPVVGEALHASVRRSLAEWMSIGCRPEVLRWFGEGVPVVFLHGPPPRYVAKSYEFKTEDERTWWRGKDGQEGEKDRLLKAGAFERVPAGAQVDFASPCFLVPKADKDGVKNYRMVVDMRILNLYCKRFSCKFDTLKLLGKMARPGDHMISFDISDAFYHVSVRPADRRWMRCIIDGEVLQMAGLPMGWTNSPYYLTKCLRPLVGALRGGGDQAALRETPVEGQRGVRPKGRLRRARVLAYLDDFLLLYSSAAEAEEGARYVKALLGRLGLHFQERKCQWDPVTSLVHLGLEVDLKHGCFRVTPARISKLEASAKDLLCRRARDKGVVDCRLLAKFTGLAQSCDLAMPACRFFLRELHTSLAAGVAATGWSGQARLSRPAIRDLEWWLTFHKASRFNGRRIWRSPTTEVLFSDAAVDSAGRGGWGARLGDHTARGFWRKDQRSWHITRLELLAVRLSVESFLDQLRGRRVLLREDNTACVRFLETFSSRSPEIQADLRKLYWLLDSNDIEIVAEYIRSADNPADAPSRQEDPGDWSLALEVFARYELLWGPHTWDRFASANNTKVLRFNAAWVCPGCPLEQVDALAQSDLEWRLRVNWVNPPWALLPRVVHKLRVSGAAATVVAPFWPTAPWWTDLMDMCSEFDVLPARADLFLPGQRGNCEPVGKANWRVVVCRVPLREQESEG